MFVDVGFDNYRNAGFVGGARVGGVEQVTGFLKTADIGVPLFPLPVDFLKKTTTTTTTS